MKKSFNNLICNNATNKKLEHKKVNNTKSTLIKKKKKYLLQDSLDKINQNITALSVSICGDFTFQNLSLHSKKIYFNDFEF